MSQVDAAPVDEFALLRAEAADLGIAPIGEVTRAEIAVPGGSVSALHWADRGDGGRAPALTALHGGGLNAHTWTATLLHLGVPAIAIDLPGHGESTWRADFDYRPERNAEAVAAVLDALAPGVRQTVVGQSLGGVTAIALAATRPDLVERLVIVDVSPGLRAEDASPVLEFISALPSFPSREALVDVAAAAGLGGDRRALERGVALNTRVRSDGTVVFKHHLAAPPDGARLDLDFSRLWAPLEAGGVPVLLVRGRTGFLSPEAVAEFARRVPRASIVEIDAGHNVQEQQPAALAAAIDEFIGATAG